MKDLVADKVYPVEIVDLYIEATPDVAEAEREFYIPRRYKLNSLEFEPDDDWEVTFCAILAEFSKRLR